MQSILITGAYGFIGKNISNYFSQNGNYDLISLDQKKTDNTNFKEFYSWNNLNLIDWDNINVIIHLAGKAHNTKNTIHSQEYFDINSGLTEKIYDYFLKSKAHKFIFFSSVKAVADIVKREILTEEEVPNPQTAYGQSKLKAEEYILKQSLPEGKKYYILRPCMIHGPGNKGNLNLLYNVVKKGIPYPLGEFNNKRSFLSIYNLSFIIEQLLIRDDITSGIYQVADDDPISTNDLIGLISDSLNRRKRIWSVNKNIISSIAIMGDILHLPLNSERLNKLTESYVVSNQKIKKILTIDKMPFSVEEGLIKTLESFNESKIK